MEDVTQSNLETPDMETEPDSYDAFLEGMKDLIAPLHSLHLQVDQACAPEVQRILHSRSRDVQQIERTLDLLLDSACIPEGLALFKALCRDCYDLNPEVALGYVSAYREIWDQEKEVGDGNQ